MKSRLRSLPAGDPDDAVGEGPLHHFVVCERFGQDGLADATHAVQCGESDGPAVSWANDVSRSITFG
jgi:hypothetical protein